MNTAANVLESLKEGSEVHYVRPENEHCIAKVTKVWHAENGVVDLSVVIDDEIQDFKEELVLYSEENHTIHTWHWPE